MKIRTKLILFIFLIFALMVVAGVWRAEYSVRSGFKEQVLSNIRVIAEVNGSTYFAFVGKLKRLTLDWSSDNRIKELAETIVSTGTPSPVRAQAVNDFTAYLNTKKMPYDRSVTIVDLLDARGIVVASSRPERIGIDEGREERLIGTLHFEKAIKGQFGEVFARSVIFEPDEDDDPVFHITTRLFSPKLGAGDSFVPLPAVLLVHFSSLQELTDLLRGEVSPTPDGNISRKGFTQSFNTSEIYLVNKDYLVVTPVRQRKTIGDNMRISTKPVIECLQNKNEITEEYVNHRGIPVLGASTCIAEDGLVLVQEIETGEAYSFFAEFLRQLIYTGSTIFIIALLTALLVMRPIFRRIAGIARAAERVSRGDLTAVAPDGNKDEIGALARSFNNMTTRLRELYTDLETKVRERTRQIEEDKEKDEALLESIGEGIIASDTDGRIIKVNRAAERTLGWTEHELIGNIFPEMVPAYDEHNEMIPAIKRPVLTALKRRVPVSLIADFSKKDGGRVPVSVITSPVTVEREIIGTITAFRDITKEREIEKMRTDLLSLASHQLRTPLSGTKWLIETLRKGIHGPLTKEQGEYIEEIYKINERMTGLVSDMLSALRIESGIESFSREVISVSSLFDAIATTMVPVAQGKNIALHFSREKSISLTIPREILRNILESFISNAIVYSSPGTEVIVNVTESKDAITFSVKDFGIGIPKDEQAGIFNRFYRASNARAVNTRGTGLGLYISIMLAKKVGATVAFESEENKGSTFYVKIPKESEGKEEE